MWMKLVKSELFIEKSWAKIVVGISFYRYKTKLPVWLKSGQNLTIGSSYNCWGSILTVGSHPNSIWTIKCTWNWPLEFGPNQDHQINAGKLGVVESEDQGSKWRRPGQPDLDLRNNARKLGVVESKDQGSRWRRRFFGKIDNANRNFAHKL